MAKQSGLHQIRGKVGEFSYYKQSGVSSGLIRGINQGLSSRVKNGEEYANTRRNNKEFANACGIAGNLGGTVVPKWRPMFLTFSQSAIAKAVLELIKQDDTTGVSWGQRSLRESDFDSAVAALNNRAKNAFSNIVTSLGVEAGTPSGTGMGQVILSGVLSQGIQNYLESINCQGVNYYVQLCYMTVGKFEPLLITVPKSQLYKIAFDSSSLDLETGLFEIALDYKKRPAPLSTLGYQKIVASLVVVPTREINDEIYEMQEFATFQTISYDEE